mmetsp:Transcript_123858/g.263950  ORF Transcript_123858/g.263950 Transcript_123858/m.263950 type:complete len:225 (+) Transcript_123858:590-1264(+)
MLQEHLQGLQVGLQLRLACCLRPPRAPVRHSVAGSTRTLAASPSPRPCCCAGFLGLRYAIYNALVLLQSCLELDAKEAAQGLRSAEDNFAACADGAAAIQALPRLVMGTALPPACLQHRLRRLATEQHVGDQLDTPPLWLPDCITVLPKHIEAGQGNRAIGEGDDNDGLFRPQVKVASVRKVRGVEEVARWCVLDKIREVLQRNSLAAQGIGLLTDTTDGRPRS